MLLRAWHAALTLFVLAALTGVAFRFALLGWPTGGLAPPNLRHAHSHLMFFGWATPALVALIAARLPRLAGRPAPAGLGPVLGGLFGTAVLAWALFARFGYATVPVGDADLPLATIAAALAMVAWYGFVALYVWWTWGIPRSPTLLRLDAALTALVLSTAGAWALAAMVPLGLTGTVVAEAAKHVFLDLFTHGFLLLGVLALVRAPGARAPRTVPLLMLGLPGLIPLSLSPAALPAPVPAVAGALSAVFAGAVAIEVLDVLRGAPRRWWLPLGAALAVACGMLVAAIRPDLGLATQPGFRLLYLHVLLLGCVSLGLVAAAREAFGARAGVAPRWLAVAAAAVIATLVPLTPLWPVGWRGGWVLVAAAWAAWLPPVVVAACGLRRVPAT